MKPPGPSAATLPAIETSARELYRPTQRFYERCGYEAEARLKDFYAPGDSKIIYVKHF